MNRIILLLLLLLPLQTTWAQTTEKAFPYLKWIDADATGFGDYRFGYEAGSFTPVGKFCNELPVTDVCYIAENDANVTLIGRYKNASMSESVNILFEPGASNDPLFFITNATNIPIWACMADQMCINSAGVIYTSGITNKMFDERHKFVLSGKMAREVAQPYLYVGIKGKLLKPVKLYSAKTGDNVVATLPTGYEIEVLLAETQGEYHGLQVSYLARTAFGLVGWLRLAEGDVHFANPVVKGLGFYGD